MAVNFESVNLGLLLGQSAALKDRLLDRHLLPLGITAAQFKVLSAIAAGQSTAGSLSRYLSINSAAMTRMLERLESKALIARSRDRRDLRQIRLALTARGHAVNARLPTLAAAAMNELVAGLTGQELSKLEHLLEKILARGTEEALVSESQSHSMT